MCGRYTQTRKLDELVARFGLTAADGDLGPSYNVAPGRPVPVILADPAPRLVLMRWGLVPSWAKDPSAGARMINARSETVAGKPAFKRLLERRRCGLPADGFFEWRKEPGGRKQPVYFRLRSRDPFRFAGLWDRWQAPDGQALHSCTILTTRPNALVQPVHDRMPVLLREDLAAAWIADRPLPEGLLEACREPYPAEAMEAYPVSGRINRPAHDDPACIEPLPDGGAPAAGQLDLF